MKTKIAHNTLLLLFMAGSSGCSAEFFEYGATNETFTISLQTSPDEVYYIEESTNLDEWILVHAESSNDPKMETSFSEDTSTESSKFFRVIKKPLAETVPLVTEFSFFGGIFHTQSDRHHRLIYHTTVELWNPYKFDIALPNETRERAYWVIIENLPVVTVEAKRSKPFGLETVLDYSIDLNDFPEEYISNSTIETLPWDWIFIENLEMPSGEVYMARTNSSRGLPRGVASSEDRWFWEAATVDPSFPVLYANDNVEISAEPCRITVHLIPFRGFTDDSVHPLDVGEPLVTLKDIPFEGFELTLLGSQYSRATSASYTLNNFIFAYHFRIKDPDQLEELLHLLTPTDSVIDFSREEVASVFEVTVDPLELVNTAGSFSPLDQFADETANSHASPREPVVLID